MEPEVARRLFVEGAVLIVEDMPIGTDFGIDYNSWRTGDRFRGVKMIPPGLHYVYFRSRDHASLRLLYVILNINLCLFSAVDRNGQTAPRTGFFCLLQKKQVEQL